MIQRLSFLLAVFLSASAAAPQSLGELAKKEKERRAKLTGQKGKTYTDRDVARAAPPPAEEEAEPSSAPAAQPAPAEEDPTKTPKYWRDRQSQIQQRISELEAQLGRPGFDQDPSNLIRRQRIEQDLQKARADMGALQEEARRKGVPAGWLR